MFGAGFSNADVIDPDHRGRAGCESLKRKLNLPEVADLAACQVMPPHVDRYEREQRLYGTEWRVESTSDFRQWNSSGIQVATPALNCASANRAPGSHVRESLIARKKRAPMGPESKF